MWHVNPERNRARAGFDRRHVFNQSYIWELPFGKQRKWLQSGPRGVDPWRLAAQWNPDADERQPDQLQLECAE
jgi:hypothetical protein